MYLKEPIVEKKKESAIINKSDFANIIEPLVYFSIFNFPLTEKEIYFYNQRNESENETSKKISFLIESEVICKNGKFLQLNENLSEINTRLINKQNFEKRKNKIKRMARIIASFPFVECICLSGSLSKEICEKDSDIDFFVITQTNRLWLCRTFLILFKKIFLLNSKKNFCINYLISKERLHIPDKNIFTAVEISSLQNLYGQETFKEFMQENNWYTQFLPNATIKESWNLVPYSNSLKKFSEFILKEKLANSLDTFLMNITLNWWKKKFSNQDNFELNFRSLKSSSKHHPRGFQKIVLEKYSNRMEKFL